MDSGSSSSSSSSSAAQVRLVRMLGHLGEKTLQARTATPSTSNAVCHVSSTSCRTSSPVRVLLTGAAGQIGYAILPLIASGQMLGPHQPIILHLLDIAPAERALAGVVMELIDCAFPLLVDVVATSDIKTAFQGVDIALLVGAFPRREGMQRKDLLERNAEIFKQQGAALEQYSSKNVKVVVVGNPANTNAFITMSCASKLPRENFTALTRLDHNRARAHIAKRLNVGISRVKNVFIWGNHSSTMYPDVRFGLVEDYPVGSGVCSQIQVAVNDDEWLRRPYLKGVQERGAEVLQARKMGSALSAARAIIDHVRDWMLGTSPGEIVSMAVASDGSYNVPKGIIYSFPVVCPGNGAYRIVQGLALDSYSRQMLDASAKELLEEREVAINFLNLPHD